MRRASTTVRRLIRGEPSGRDVAAGGRALVEKHDPEWNSH
jgi:hypothetical protein